MMKEGYVYFFQKRDTRLFKIGYSRDPEQRRKSLEQTQFYILDFFALYQTFEPEEEEQKWHEFFRHRRVRSEWFELEENEMRLVRKCAYENQCEFEEQIKNEILPTR